MTNPQKIEGEKIKTYNDFEPFSKDQAYWERNQLVVALSKLYPSWMELHPLEDKDWDKDWRHIIFIKIPVRFRVDYHEGYRPEQLSWHIHDSEVVWFDHLELRKGNSWDGHTTEEKYERLSKIKPL
jgi:hypothetical protein